MPMPRRTSRSLPVAVLSAVVLATVLAVLLPAATATAATARTGEEPVGGGRLADSGIVVDRASPALPEIAAESWLVADLDTGQVLAAKDPHGQYAPASTLKTLTALTLIPVIEAERRIVPTFEDVNVDGSKVGIVERVAYPAGELFSALLMVSGNDAANALATAAGGQQVTAGLMNARARELGALDTFAVNPHGLDAPGQLSSAYDLALIGRAGLADADFARYVATVSSSVSGPGGQRITIANKNKMLRNYPGSLGVKNGFTSRARASFIGAAERDGRRLVVTVMKSTPKVFDEAAKLLDWGFAATASGASAEPVGELVPDQAVAVELPVVSAQRTIGPPTSLAQAPDGTGLPVTLAGMALAAAAVFSVRHRPRMKDSTRRPALPRTPVQRRSAPRTPVGAGRP